MSRHSGANKPLVITFDGSVDDDIRFEYIDDMPVGSGSCPATINGEFFMFGGYNKKTKVSLTHPRENFYNSQ